MMNSATMTQIFHISPLIRIALSLLYISLTVPLPFMATATHAAVSPTFLWFGIGLGFVALQGALSQRVVVDESTIQVNYPVWVPSFFTKSWSVAWSDVTALKSRTTGQGGLVYYFIDRNEQGFLLPMRVAGFNKLVQLVQQYTSIDTTDIRPLSQPWMYFALLIVTALLLLVDAWTIWTAVLI